MNAVRAKLREVSTELGEDDVHEILDRFDADTAADLDPEDYLNVIESCDELLAE
jgi:tRNA A37 N6-isopentenylltransferase MiaA